jgi:uncharacterized protein YjeT (DUF2065 family)
MQNAVFIAKVLGPVYLIVGLGALLNPEHMKSMMRALASNPAFIYMSGVMALAIGTLMLRFYHDWTWGWPILVTALGWGSVLKGASRLLAPAWSEASLKSYADSGKTVPVAAAASLLVGAVLTAGGYGWI